MSTASQALHRDSGQDVVWFIVQAEVTVAILVLGTLGAAELLSRPRRLARRDDPTDAVDTPIDTQRVTQKGKP